MDIIAKKSNIENNSSKVELELSNSNSKTKSILNLKLKPNQYLKPKPTIKPEKTVVSQQSKPKVEKSTKNINQAPQIQTQLLSITQWILVIYNLIFLAIIIGAIFLEWTSIWQLPKSLIFILGVTGFLFLTSALWIIGQIRQKVAITLEIGRAHV